MKKTKGGKRKGSGRKRMNGKEVKIKIPYETIDEISINFSGTTLAEKIRKSINKSLGKEQKYRVLDLFSGCGGISEGFSQNKNMEIVGGIDFDKQACTTFKYNFPNSKVICGDMTSIDTKKSGFNDIDIIVGGPPCQGFSAANRHQNCEKDPRNKLFFEYLRFVKQLKPKVIVLENVKQILTKNNGYAKNKICSILDEIGYNVDYRLIDCSDYGVPQKRNRVVFVGIRKDIGCPDFELLEKQKVKIKTTVKDALEDLYGLENSSPNDGDDVYVIKKPKTNQYLEKMHNEYSIIYNHRIQYQNEEVQKRVSYVPQGGNWRNVPEELFPSHRNNRQSNYLRRLDEKDQSITIDTGHDVYYHPLFNRVPTVRESARLQSFPDDFLFIGTRSEQLRQVGNAVPPMLAYAISKMVEEVIEKWN